MNDETGEAGTGGRKNVAMPVLSSAIFFLAAMFLTLGWIQQDWTTTIVGVGFFAIGVHFLPIWRRRRRSDP